MATVVTNFSTPVLQKSTAIFPITFKDENDDATTPTAVTWSLYSVEDETVINGRLDVVIAAAESINIVLSGDDLDINDDGLLRALVIEATYNSTLGSGLPLIAKAMFEIEEVIGA